MAIEIDLPLAPDAGADRLAAELTEVGNERFLRAVLHDPVALHHRSTDRLVGRPHTPTAPESGGSLLLRALHTAFAAHLPLSLSPDLLWYAIVHEVAVHVRLNPDAYAGLFGATADGKQTVRVHDDHAMFDWQRSIHLVREPLAAAVGAEAVELFRPAFSTTTPTESAAALVALMDVVSPYVRFEWITMCGIPRIRLEGTADDWALLASRTRELAGWFDGLRLWFKGLRPVLDTVAATAAGADVNQDFWRSIYKHESQSGGDFVTGWINAFLAHRYPGDGPVAKREFGAGRVSESEFPSHVSRVPFEWHFPGLTLEMAFLGGVLGIERDGEWLRPRLGQAVAELLPRTGPLDPRLPERWQLADIRRVTGQPGARIVDTVTRIRHEGGWAEATVVIGADRGLLLLGTADGRWHVGEPGTEPGVAHALWSEADLPSALSWL
ncbi:DUF4419 domain-containing protein [Kitasatospora terrestris]|uniref:DUF4419 domain-containing protein n=1 Tax=Kitasatospora terrestris TaxID=258051 RepID=A0ABP9DDX4_9ACTN